MSVSVAISALLTVPIVTSALYFVIAARLIERWMQDGGVDEQSDEPLPPVTFFRPLKAGVPQLREKLEMLARALRPRDQLLIGAETGSMELAIAEKVRQSFSAADIVVVPCAAGGAANPKIAKLTQMESSARYEHWLLSDSEALLEADFLAAFRWEWRSCDVLTAAYRFTDARSWPQRIDAAAVLLTLWPGLAMLRAFGRVHLTLGACTGFRRADLEAVGGWRAFSDELAEDHALGKALAEAGHKIQLSRHIVSLDSDALTWREYWRHQCRVAVTYRIANPVGFAGAILSQGVTLGLVLAVLQPAELWRWALFGAVLAIRWRTAHRTAKRLAFPFRGLGLIVLIASLIETICWVLSWGTNRVWWAGAQRRISRGGRLFEA